jgi:endonuclease III
VGEHGGEVPADRDALHKLPGVGRKTANVVMNCAFGAETFAVDTHIFRVANRTGLAPGKNPQVEAMLDKVTPPPFRRDAHHLADPPRPLRVQGAQARMLALRRQDLCRYRPKTPAPGSEEENRLEAAGKPRHRQGRRRSPDRAA